MCDQLEAKKQGVRKINSLIKVLNELEDFKCEMTPKGDSGVEEAMKFYLYSEQNDGNWLTCSIKSIRNGGVKQAMKLKEAWMNMSKTAHSVMMMELDKQIESIKNEIKSFQL